MPFLFLASTARTVHGSVGEHVLCFSRQIVEPSGDLIGVASQSSLVRVIADNIELFHQQLGGRTLSEIKLSNRGIITVQDSSSYWDAFRSIFHHVC
jgi:hypothetical protein